MADRPRNDNYPALHPQAIFAASNDGHSNPIALGAIGPRGVAIEMPTTDWQAANIGFSGSDDGTTNWIPIVDEEGERILITGIDSGEQRCYQGPGDLWSLGSYPFMRVDSVNTGSPFAYVNQTANPTLIVRMLG